MAVCNGQDGARPSRVLPRRHPLAAPRILDAVVGATDEATAGHPSARGLHCDGAASRSMTRTSPLGVAPPPPSVTRAAVRLCNPSRSARHRAAPRHASCIPRPWHNRTVSPVSLSACLGWPPTASPSLCRGAGGRPTSSARRRCRRRHRYHRRQTGTQRRGHPRAAAATPPPRKPPLCDGGRRRRRGTALPTDTTPSLAGCGCTVMVGAVSPCSPPPNTLRRSADPTTGRRRHTAGMAASRRGRHRCRHCPREHLRREHHRHHRQSTTPTVVGQQHGCADSTRTLNAPSRRHGHNNHRHTTATATAIGTTTMATTPQPPPPNPRHRPSSPPQPPGTTVRSSVTTPLRAR